MNHSYYWCNLCSCIAISSRGWCPLLSSAGTRQACSAHTYLQAKHSYTSNKLIIINCYQNHAPNPTNPTRLKTKYFEISPSENTKSLHQWVSSVVKRHLPPKSDDRTHRRKSKRSWQLSKFVHMHMHVHTYTHTHQINK